MWAASVGLLHDAERVERVGRQVAEAATFRKRIARMVLAPQSVPAVGRGLASEVSTTTSSCDVS